MRIPRSEQSGFTLVELLTVIAIISILFALTFTVGPKVLERAKLVDTQSRFNQLRIVLTDYYTQHGTYPPAYGYLEPDAPDDFPFALADIDLPNPPNDEHDFNVLSWMHILEEHENFDLYDPWSQSVDTNLNGEIELLEFSPLEDGPDITGREEVYEDGTYGGQNLDPERTDQLDADTRPFIYIPVNKRQVQRVADRLFELADVNLNNDNDETNDDPRPNDSNAAWVIDVLVNLAAQERFPPAKYDAYVLISVGPAGSTNGLLYDFVRPELDTGLYNPIPPDPLQGVYRYHIAGLLTYIMATRDANNNGLLDFDFLTRTREAEGDYQNSDGVYTNRLPDVAMPNGAGPLIFVSD